MNSTNHCFSKNGMPFSSVSFLLGFNRLNVEKIFLPRSFSSTLSEFREVGAFSITAWHCPVGHNVLRPRRSRCPAPNVLQLVLPGQLPLHSSQSHLGGLQTLKSCSPRGVCSVEFHPTPTNYFVRKFRTLGYSHIGRDWDMNFLSI